MIKVLHVVASLGSGGVESLLYNYYLNMKEEKVRFDFIVHGDEKGIFEEEFKKIGSKIFHVPPRKKSFIRNIKAIKKIIKDNEYDVVHSHLEHMSFIPLYYAKKYKVPVRVAHTHLSYQDKLITKLIKKPLYFLVKKMGNVFLGCSKDAISNSFGKKFKKASVLYNAIDKDKFTFNADSRRIIRKKYELDNKTVIGNVGRFTNQKNPLFLIEIFHEINKIDRETKLVMIGEGPLNQEINEKIKRLNLMNDVIIIEPVLNVNEFMSAFDIFIFPSIYEGLGIVLIEAQSMNLSCFASEKVIPIETKISSNVEYISLDNPAKEWAEIIVNKKLPNRLGNNDFVDKHNYNIKAEANKLIEKYREII